MAKKNIAALGCWIVAFGALLVIFRAGHPAQAHLMHSDALYLPVLFDDLLRNDGRFADWFLTPAPYFFPDMPLYWLAWLAGSGVPGQTTAFAVLQAMLAALALYLLAGQAFPQRPHLALPAAAALSIVFIWLGLNADDPFVRLFSSAHHYGAFVAALLLGALWLGQENGAECKPGKPGRPANVANVAMVALAFLTTLSDALFLAQAIIPLFAAALLCRHGAPRSTAPGRAALLMLAPALAGMLSYRFVVAHPTRHPTRPGLSRLPENWAEMGNICSTLFASRPLLAAALLLSLAFGVACILACLRRRPLPGLPRPLQVLAVFATLSCAATVAAMLLSTTMQPVPRYLIGALSWPLVAGLFGINHLLDARWRGAGPPLSPTLCLSLCLAFSGLLAAEAWRVRDVRDTGRYFYPEQVACIDRSLAAAGARYGMAQYWDAKRLQGLSHQRMTLAQYTGELDRMEWITSGRFYRAAYDFAILADQEPAQFRLPRARLVAQSGEPLRAVACGDRTVLLYGSGRLQAPGAPVR